MEEDLILAGLGLLTLGSLLGLVRFVVRRRSRPSRSDGWGAVLAVNLLGVLLALSLAALLGECAFRFWFDGTDSFALAKTSQRFAARYYHDNRSGFRDNVEYAPLRSPDRRRITFIGDSFANGNGIRDVNDRFANLIRRMRPDWEVHVLAVPGYDSGSELRALDSLAGSFYELDCVVLVYCLNDIGDATQELADRYAEIARRCYQQHPGFMIEHSFLLNTLYYRMLALTIPEISGYHRCHHDAYFGRAWEAHTPRLKAMREIVRARGAELCVVTFPYLHSLGPGYGFRDVHLRLGDLWRGLGVPHLDLLPVFEPYPPRRLTVNRRDAHPNELAHSLAAGAIADFLAEQPWLKASQWPQRAGELSAPASAAAADALVECYQAVLRADPENAEAGRQLGLVLARREP